MIDESKADIDIDIRVVELSQIEVNDYNPNDMASGIFELLVERIKEEGMQQPILIRDNHKKPGYFTIVDGEHRFRASQHAGLKEVVAVVVDYDNDLSKFKTISMNQIKGEYIPLRMAKLIADLQDRFDDDHIRRMTGLKADVLLSLSDLLEIPEIDFDDQATITVMDINRPIAVNIMLMPDEHKDFQQAMIKAMELSGPLVIPLIAEQVAQYDKAMTTVFNLEGIKLRNVGLATLCRVFNALPIEDKEKMVKDVSEVK